MSRMRIKKEYYDDKEEDDIKDDTILTKMITMTLQQVIITTDNVDVGTVDNQENVEPDNRKDPARFSSNNLIFFSSCH